MPPAKYSPLNGELASEVDSTKTEKNSTAAAVVVSLRGYAQDIPKATYTIVSEEDNDEENRNFAADRKDFLAAEEEFTSTAASTATNEENFSEKVEGVILEENSTTKERLFILLGQAGPVTASFFLGFLGTFTNLIFASHFIGDDGGKSTVFAAVSLANMFANVSCMSLMIGTIIDGYG
jgi:hypothetical protein